LNRHDEETTEVDVNWHLLEGILAMIKRCMVNVQFFNWHIEFVVITLTKAE
jgi:hypothetical protein